MKIQVHALSAESIAIPDAEEEREEAEIRGLIRKVASSFRIGSKKVKESKSVPQSPMLGPKIADGRGRVWVLPPIFPPNSPQSPQSPISCKPKILHWPWLFYSFFYCFLLFSLGFFQIFPFFKFNFSNF